MSGLAAAMTGEWLSGTFWTEIMRGGQRSKWEL